MKIRQWIDLQYCLVNSCGQPKTLTIAFLGGPIDAHSLSDKLESLDCQHIMGMP